MNKNPANSDEPKAPQNFFIALALTVILMTVLVVFAPAIPLLFKAGYIMRAHPTTSIASWFYWALGFGAIVSALWLINAHIKMMKEASFTLGRFFLLLSVAGISIFAVNDLKVLQTAYDGFEAEVRQEVNSLIVPNLRPTKVVINYDSPGTPIKKDKTR